MASNSKYSSLLQSFNPTKVHIYINRHSRTCHCYESLRHVYMITHVASGVIRVLEFSLTVFTTLLRYVSTLLRDLSVRVLLPSRLEIPVSKKSSPVIVGVKQLDPQEEAAKIFRNVVNHLPNDKSVLSRKT